MLPQLSGPFQPAGKTSRLATSGTTANIALSTPIAGNDAEQLQIINVSTAVAYVAFGTNNTVTASAGTSGTSTSDYAIAANARIVVTPPIGTEWVAIILESSTGEALFTPGAGIT